MTRSRLLVLPLLAALTASAFAADDALPPGVVARVYGRDIREEDLLDRLAKRWGPTESGKSTLQKIVDDTCVGIEAKRRGVTVSDEEVAEYVKKVDAAIRRQTGGARTIEDVYKEPNSSPEEFAREARQYLTQAKMAIEDMGGKPGEDLPEARRMLWLSSLRRRMNVKLVDLPEGVLATVGDVTIDRRTFAAALKDSLPEDAVTDARGDLVLEAAADHAVTEAKIEVTDADVEAEIAKMRKAFENDARVKGTGLAFEEFLRQSRGITTNELRTDRAMRSWIGLDRLLSKSISEEDVRKHWEDNRDAYGERALVRQIRIAAHAEGDKFRVRSFDEAKELALRAKAAVLESSGALPGTPKEGRKTLPEAVTAVAKQFETDPEQRKFAGDAVAYTHVNLLGEKSLDEAFFNGPIGVLQGPVRTTGGWHVFVVEERRPAPPFEDVKDRVRQNLLRAAIDRFRLSTRGDPNVILAK
jgi:parvulin-like peptidyl-prolyl isomerase